MPASPEFGDGPTQVGEFEIQQQFDTEKPGYAPGNVGIAAEIAIDLDGEIHRTEHETASAILFVSPEDAVHFNGHRVSNDQFLEESPEGQPQSVNGQFIIKGPAFFQLRQQVRGTLDRSCHQQREVTHEQTVIRPVAGWCDPAIVNVDHIRKSMKGIERDAYGQQDLERPGIGLHAQGLQQTDGRVYKKVEVLEEPEKAEVRRYADP